MEFETLKKDNRRWFLVGVGIALVIAIVLCFVGTRAKYKLTQSMQVATGTINYVGADFIIVSMTDSNGNELTTMPSSGYIIDEEKSYCLVNGVKDDNVILKTIDGNHTFANLQKGSKCYLVFEEVPTKIVNTVLGALTINLDTPNFANTSCATNTNCEDKSSCSTSCGEATNGIYEGTDADGTTYYYRGSVDNNWVSFADFYWRIIRINGNGTIRLIYNGTSAGATGTNAQLSSTSQFNSDSSNNDNAYVGYMYGTVGSSTYATTHTNTNDSIIKSYIDTWYESNLKTNYASYLDGNTGWCGDRSIDSSYGTGLGYGTNQTGYMARNRLSTNKNPSYECSQSNDLYTTSGATKGNKALSYPIGLITADEVAYAGGKYGTSNYGYWLYTGSTYWTLSPYGVYESDFVSVFHMFSDGSLSDYFWFYSSGVRPVINLKADTQFTGSGTIDDPYVVS